MKAKTFKGLLKYFKTLVLDGRMQTDENVYEFIHTYFPIETVIETNIYELDSDELDEVFDL